MTGQLESVNLRYDGEIAAHDTNLLRAACLVGILSPISDERVNLINANLHASQRGLRISEQKSPTAEQLSSMVTVEMETTKGKIAISASHVRGETHIVRINNYWIDIVPTGGYMLIASHQDRPGMIGAVGTITGKHDINISFMEVGRMEPRGPATMIIGLDDPLTDAVLAEINTLPNMVQTVVVQL